ncbi:hypothetical protein SASPL_102214 [Salvia splendens]|uniref:Uncharacterized protein n=1 Tax=Salvia splendens TaxID=180675 RepID=A0A8X8YWA3_SALSN|nr:hypothetical protein SASPL_102214 [Salvia splendens]
MVGGVREENDGEGPGDKWVGATAPHLIPRHSRGIPHALRVEFDDRGGVRRGVRVGLQMLVRWGEEERVGVVVRKGQVTEAVAMLMEGQDRRRRARDLGVVAMSKTETGGSAQLNIVLLIQDILRQLSLTPN